MSAWLPSFYIDINRNRPNINTCQFNDSLRDSEGVHKQLITEINNILFSCSFIRLREQELHTASKLVKNNITHDTAVTSVFYFKTVQIPALGDVFR